MKEKIKNKYVYWGITAFCVSVVIFESTMLRTNNPKPTIGIIGTIFLFIFFPFFRQKKPFRAICIQGILP